MHPSGYSDGSRLADHYLINVIGNPLASTVAVSHLIFGGVLEAYPRLKMVVAHGGGFLPAYSGRMDHAHRARSDLRREIRKPWALASSRAQRRRRSSAGMRCGCWGSGKEG